MKLLDYAKEHLVKTLISVVVFSVLGITGSKIIINNFFSSQPNVGESPKGEEKETVNLDKIIKISQNEYNETLENLRSLEDENKNLQEKINDLTTRDNSLEEEKNQLLQANQDLVNNEKQLREKIENLENELLIIGRLPQPKIVKNGESYWVEKGKPIYAINNSNYFSFRGIISHQHISYSRKLDQLVRDNRTNEYKLKKGSGNATLRAGRFLEFHVNNDDSYQACTMTLIDTKVEENREFANMSVQCNEI